MRTRLDAVDNGAVGRERVLLELHPWPRNHDLATHGGARGREATAVLDELSHQPTPRAGTRDGKAGTRVRRDGVATEFVHRGHLLPRSVVGPLFGHGCSLRRGRATWQLVFRHVFVAPGTLRLTMPTSLRRARGGRLIHGAAPGRRRTGAISRIPTCPAAAPSPVYEARMVAAGRGERGALRGGVRCQGAWRSPAAPFPGAARWPRRRRHGRAYRRPHGRACTRS